MQKVETASNHCLTKYSADRHEAWYVVLLMNNNFVLVLV